MSILLHSAFMPHYFISSLRSFCLLKVAHLFNCVSLNILSGFLCDFDSALSVTSLSLPYLSFLSSLRVSLGILFSSLLGISLSSSFDHLSPLSLIGLLLPFLLPFLSRLSFPFFSPLSSFLPLSQLGHIVQLALGNSFSLCSFSLSFILCCIILSPSPFFPFLSFSIPSSLSSAFLRPFGVQLVAYCSARSIFLLLSPSLLPFGSAWAYCPVRP